MAKITFEMPRGNGEFDSMEKGEKMKVTCTIQKEGPDEACLVTVGGATLEGYDDPEEDSEEGSEEESPEDGDMMSALDENM